MKVESRSTTQDERSETLLHGPAPSGRFRARMATPSAEIAAAPRPDGKPRWWRDGRRRRMLGVADLVVAAGVGAAIVSLAGADWWWALVTAPLGPLFAKLFGLYDIDHRAIHHLTVDELSKLGGWAGVMVATTAVIIPGDLQVITFVLVVPVATFVAFCCRAIARAAWRRITPKERTLVIGEGAPAVGIARKIELFDDMHLELASTEHPSTFDGLNGHTDAVTSAALSRIDRIILAWSNADPGLIERLLTHCRQHEVKLSVVSPFRGLARPSEKVSHVADLPVLEYNTWDIPRSTIALKRGLDLIVSAVLLVVLAPLFALIALAVKLDSSGPVFYRQARAGRRGQTFTMFKFRSMIDGAEERLSEVISIDELEAPVFKLRADPRVTRVGRFLRRFSLDELPQLINVLRGEMSLVGPRPEETMLVERYEPEHMFRLELRPGMTGPMQVLGRGELTFAERLAVDMDYLETLSVARDLRLLVLTAPAVIRGRGAF